MYVIRSAINRHPSYNGNLLNQNLGKIHWIPAKTDDFEYFLIYDF